MSRLALVAPIVFGCLCAAAPTRAQDAPSESPAHISVVDGAALLERDGESETAPASMPLLAGDRVRTQNGRIEILFNDGSTLHLDLNTVVDFQSDEVIRLLGGRVRLNIVAAGNANRSVAYRVDASSAWVEIGRTGEYRIAVLGAAGQAGDGVAEVELAVLRGAADLVNEDGRTALGAGERAFARAGTGPSASYVYNSASWDSFDRWSEARRDSRIGVSAAYLPDTVQTYAATFNQHGSWQNEPTYGQVWYPRVRAGWRPYYYGRWSTLRPWGWTWIGSDPWAWPTHHYGRWGFSAGAWFWIPGRTWGPAWVSWAYAPGYVSWCPLGWNNRPVFGFSSAGVYRGNRYDHWNAWTVVPHRGFGRGYVNVNVVNSTRIDVRTRNSFVVRDSSPDFRGYAVPRSGAPIRSVGVRGGSVNGTAAYRGPTRAAPENDAGAAFRSRGASAAPLGGSGYPAPAREPRAMSSLPSPGRTGTVRSRDGAPAASPDARYGSATATRATPAVPDARPDAAARAAPRRVIPSTPAVSASPSRRAPEYRERAAPESYTPRTSSRPDVNRAVPRAERPAAGGVNDGGAPAAPNRVSPDRYYRTPSQTAPDRSPRATPRSSPDSSAPPAGYRSRPGPERSEPAPSGRPPSAAPSRPSGQPSGAPSGGESRSRSGGSSGRAVPRGGRG